MRKFTADPQALFRYRGLPPVGLTVSMALQHLVAMIVGCVTPADHHRPRRWALTHSGAGAADPGVSGAVCRYPRCCSFSPSGGRFGSGLPVILGVSFAYVPSMQAIAASGRGGMAAIAGAMLVGGVVAVLVGSFVKKPIRRLFPACHHRHRGVYHRPVPLSHRHQLYGRRHRQHS